MQETSSPEGICRRTVQPAVLGWPRRGHELPPALSVKAAVPGCRKTRRQILGSNHPIFGLRTTPRPSPRLRGCDEGFAREPRSRAHPQLPPRHAGQALLWGSVPHPSPCSSHPRLLAGALPVRRHRPFQLGRAVSPARRTARRLSAVGMGSPVTL